MSELYRMLEEIEDDEITCCSFPMISEPVDIDAIPQDAIDELCAMEIIPLVIDSGDSQDEEWTRFSFPVSTETIDPEFFSQATSLLNDGCATNMPTSTSIAGSGAIQNLQNISGGTLTS